MNFSINYDKQPKKFLKKHDKHILRRFFSKIRETLSDNPVPHDAKTMVNTHGVFRIRIVDFRVLYRVDYQEHKVVVLKMDKREKVYD
jgi:mRNA interferase RelE/StbE